MVTKPPHIANALWNAPLSSPHNIKRNYIPEAITGQRMGLRLNCIMPSSAFDFYLIVPSISYACKRTLRSISAHKGINPEILSIRVCLDFAKITPPCILKWMRFSLCHSFVKKFNITSWNQFSKKVKVKINLHFPLLCTSISVVETSFRLDCRSVCILLLNRILHFLWDNFLFHPKPGIQKLNGNNLPLCSCRWFYDSFTVILQ